MSHKSNGRPVDASIIGPRGSNDRALNPPPLPLESRIETRLVPVRSKLACHGGTFVGWIDLEQCFRIRLRYPADHERFRRDHPGRPFEFSELYRTHDGRFFVAITNPPAHPYERTKQYVVFITELEAAGWFDDNPESIPKCMRPLVEAFDLTKPPADRPELVAAAPSGNGTDATNDRAPEALDPNLLADDLAVAVWTRLSHEKGQPPSIARVAREIGHTRQHLYRCRHFMSLVATEKAEREERRQRLARGCKDVSGGVEAYQDED